MSVAKPICLLIYCKPTRLIPFLARFRSPWRGGLICIGPWNRWSADVTHHRRIWGWRRPSPAPRSTPEHREDGLTDSLISLYRRFRGWRRRGHVQRSAAEPAWIRLINSLELPPRPPFLCAIRQLSPTRFSLSICFVCLKFWGVWIDLPFSVLVTFTPLFQV